MTEPSPIFFQVLSGFLGAGKTTLLNRLLSIPHGRRIGILVNELGRIDIDRRLIKARYGDFIDLSGGCVCCQVDTQKELWESIQDIIKRFDPEHLILETTGIADPLSLLSRWDESLAERLAFLGDNQRLTFAGVVTVVDATCAPMMFEAHDEARAQVQAAHRVFLSKLDAASADDVTKTHVAVRAINDHVERIGGFPDSPDGNAALAEWFLTTQARIPVAGARRGDDNHDHQSGAHAHHHGQLVAVSFVDDAPLVAAPLLDLVNSLGDRLVRAKGFVHLHGDDRRGFLERAGLRTELRFEGPWPDDQPRRTELVFIGDGLNEVTLRGQLWACRANRSLSSHG